MISLMLALSVNIVLLAIILGMQPMLRSAKHGVAYALSSLDDHKPDSVFQARLARVRANQMETVILLTPVVLAALAAQLETGHLAMAATVIIVGRIAYVLSALAGIPVVRSAAWLAGFVAWAYVAMQVLPKVS